MARMAGMARLYDSHGSHGSLVRTLSKLSSTYRDFTFKKLTRLCITQDRRYLAIVVIGLTGDNASFLFLLW